MRGLDRRLGWVGPGVSQSRVWSDGEISPPKGRLNLRNQSPALDSVSGNIFLVEFTGLHHPNLISSGGGQTGLKFRELYRSQVPAVDSEEGDILTRPSGRLSGQPGRELTTFVALDQVSEGRAPLALN